MMTGSLMRLHIDTGDPEHAHDWLRTTYVDHTARLSGSREGFRFQHRLADCGPFTVGVAQHTMTLHGDWEPLEDTLLVSHLLAGRFHIRSHRSAVVAAPGDVFAYDPETRMSVVWSDIRMANIRMPRAAVDRVAATLIGDDRPSGPVGFELARPLSEGAALNWKRLMQYVTADVASNGAVHASPILIGQLFRLIVATAVETFPNTTLHRARYSALPASPASVRRAVAFMEERAGEDIDLTDIAEAAHVGPRALQRAFRRSLDCTPLGHLRSVRLLRAHQELAAASDADGTTVVGVAARWGFGHPGRFAAAYRTRFGRTPSETLRG
jgi:AraC-like DNA-binding protein